MSFVLIIIAICASTIGAITGIGGGVIIKPVVDILGILPVSTASFLSGCTVLSMSVISLIKSKKNTIQIDLKYSTYLAIGAAVGGIIGKVIFDYIKNNFQNDNILVFLQSVILLLLTVMVLVYMMNKSKIKTYSVTSKIAISIAGLVLGIFSAFLGIGGGPINLVVLYMLFSMDAKTAAVNSIYIIFCSQVANLLFTTITGNTPQFEVLSLVAMVIGGISGGFLGSEILKRISGNGVNKVFNVLLIIIIIICGINIWRCF